MTKCEHPCNADATHVIQRVMGSEIEYLYEVCELHHDFWVAKGEHESQGWIPGLLLNKDKFFEELYT